MTYDEVIGVIKPLVGERIRVTALNNYQRVGVVGLWNCPGRDPIPTLGGNLCGGEYDKSIRVEVMAPNGRYRIVAG